MTGYGSLEFRIMSAASGDDSSVMNEPINVKAVLLDQEATKISRVALYLVNVENVAAERCVHLKTANGTTMIMPLVTKEESKKNGRKHHHR